MRYRLRSLKEVVNICGVFHNVLSDEEYYGRELNRVIASYKAIGGF